MTDSPGPSASRGPVQPREEVGTEQQRAGQSGRLRDSSWVVGVCGVGAEVSWPLNLLVMT